MATLKLVKEQSFYESDLMGPYVARVVAILSDYTPPTNTTGDIFIANARAKQEAVNIAGIGEGDGFPGFPNTTCACQRVRAASTGGISWIVTWDFERPTFGNNGGSFGTLYLVDQQRVFLDVSRVTRPHVNDGNPIKVGWTDPSDANNKIQPQIVKRSIRKPALQAVIYGRFTTDPTYGHQPTGGDPVTTRLMTTAQGCINKTTWQTYARGYWLFAGANIHRDPGSNIRSIQCTLLNLLDEDWSDYIIVEHPSGIIAPVTSAQIAALDTIYPSAANDYFRPSASDALTNGIVRVGEYPEIEFSQVFAALSTQ